MPGLAHVHRFFPDEALGEESGLVGDLFIGSPRVIRGVADRRRETVDRVICVLGGGNKRLVLRLPDQRERYRDLAG